MSLTEVEEDAIKGKLSRFSTMLTSAIAKLYIADPESERYEWQDTKVSGALVLLVNRKLNTCIVRMFDVRNEVSVVFEYEVYIGIRYQRLSEIFHAIEMEKHVLGIMFSDAEAAEEFAERFEQLVVKGKAAEKDEDEEEEENSFKRRTISQRIKDAGSKAYGFVKMQNSGNSSSRSLRTPNSFSSCELGDVMRVDHIAHVGLSDDGKIDWTVIPKEWKDAFRANGMKKKDFDRNPVLKQKLVKKYKKYIKNHRPAPRRPKSAKPRVRHVKSDPSAKTQTPRKEMSADKRRRFIETFRKMRGKVADIHIKNAMITKGIDPDLVFGVDADKQEEEETDAPKLPVRERPRQAKSDRSNVASPVTKRSPVAARPTTTTKSSNVSRFQKMVKIGMPENAIRGRMTAAGISQEDIDGMFGHAGPVIKKCSAPTMHSQPVKLRSVKRRVAVEKKKPMSAPSLMQQLKAQRKQMHKLDMDKVKKEKEAFEKKKKEGSAMEQFRDIFAARRKNLGGDFTSSGEEWSEGEDDKFDF
eukprot:g744.t1